jgi:toxin ParE1/3/4
MGFAVRLSASAERDLAEIVDYISRSDSPEKARHVLDHLVEAIEGLTAFPERGSCPRELLVLGIREYRQVFFKPYRVIYRLEGKQVQVFLIADGRRDMKALLARRLLGG